LIALKGNYLFAEKRIAPRVFKGFCNPARRRGKQLSLKIPYYRECADAADGSISAQSVYPEACC